MDFTSILNRIPDYKVFYTVNELDERGRDLARKHPDTVECYSIGSSGEGRPIRCLKIGNGAKNALCYACPHPNEPIGAMTLITLAEIFAGDPGLLEETGMTWYLIPCVDPDGTALNENWFKGPFDIEHYVRGFFRPGGRFQVEWTFPFKYRDLEYNKPIPETKLLMGLIDEVRPAFTYSLHNLAFGGAFWYLNAENTELCKKLENSAHRQNIPLHLGEAEAEYIKRYSGSVFGALSLREYYEDLEKRTGKRFEGPLVSGTCSWDYIPTVCDSMILATELPYFVDERIGDNSTGTMTRGEALTKRDKRKYAHFAFMRKIMAEVRGLMREDNPFPILIDEILNAYGDDIPEYKGPEYDRYATVAEEIDCLCISQIFELVNLGMTIRGCRKELAENPALSEDEAARLRAAIKAVDAELSAECAQIEENTDYKVVPIKKLVSVQIESALQCISFCR